MNITFSERIKELRTDANMNQADFAKLICTNQSTLSAYENGDRLPPYETLLCIAQQFNISLDWLCGLKKKKSISSELQTYSDLIELLFNLEKTKIEFERYIIHHDEDDPLTPTLHCIGFVDPVITLFLKSWKKTYSLYRDDTIDATIYTAWKDKIKKDFNQDFLNYTTKRKFDEIRLDAPFFTEYESVLKALTELNNKPNTSLMDDTNEAPAD